MDIELFINDKGEGSAKGWDFPNKDAILDTLTRKIYYIQYNQKQNVTDGNDFVYATIGAIGGVTLGTGMVMNSYRNTLDHPMEKRIGLDAYFVHPGAATVDELFEWSPSVLMGAEVKFKLGESTAIAYEYQRSFGQDGEPVDQMTVGTQTTLARD